MPRDFDKSFARPPFPRLYRLSPRKIPAARFFRGGRVTDGGRLPRYALLLGLGAVLLWAPVLGYLASAPLRYRSELSLILPGAGSSASINLDRIGQASSSASSPYASSAVSPTETYKRLLGAERILAAAATALALPTAEFGKPRVELVDQTGLIHVSVTGGSPEDAKTRGDALLAAFFSEIEALRADEIAMREIGAGDAIAQYRRSVLATRDEITRLQQETRLISAAQYEALVAETDALAERVRDLTGAQKDKTAEVDSIQRALGITPQLAAAALRLHADTEFAALAAEMSEQSAQLALAAGRFGTRHPLVSAARAGHATALRDARLRARALTGLPDDALDALDVSHVGSRADLLSNLVAAEAERAGLAAQLAVMTDRLEAAETRRLALIEPAAKLEDLQRDFAVAEAVFASTMARTQTGKADLFASYPLVQVLEDPSLPQSPSSPSRKLALAAGAAATILWGMGLALGWLRRPLIDRLLAGQSAERPIMAAAE